MGWFTRSQGNPGKFGRALVAALPVMLKEKEAETLTQFLKGLPRAEDRRIEHEMFFFLVSMFWKLSWCSPLGRNRSQHRAAMDAFRASIDQVAGTDARTYRAHIDVRTRLYADAFDSDMEGVPPKTLPESFPNTAGVLLAHSGLLVLPDAEQYEGTVSLYVGEVVEKLAHAVSFLLERFELVTA